MKEVRETKKVWGSLDEGPERVKGLLESGIGEKRAGKLGRWWDV